MTTPSWKAVLLGDNPWVPGIIFNDRPGLAERLARVIEEYDREIESWDQYAEILKAGHENGWNARIRPSYIEFTSQESKSLVFVQWNIQWNGPSRLDRVYTWAAGKGTGGEGSIMTTEDIVQLLQEGGW